MRFAGGSGIVSIIGIVSCGIVSFGIVSCGIVSLGIVSTGGSFFSGGLGLLQLANTTKSNRKM
ncbi:MAG: hypothetical protein LBN95_04335 [Prevotellaceae bacterium]|nr:hypothetical protein [Prevotellaceae bacterium]